MLAVSSSIGADCASIASRRPTLRPKQVRRLVRGETLFQSGDERLQLYRVERGALCHYQRQDDGHHEVIEFAFPGDIIGFGHLAQYTSTAQAVAKTIVSPVSEEEFEQLLDSDGQLAARYSAAADREFDFLRVRAVASSAGKPAKRVASFLVALARMGAAEGRDGSIITEELSSGIVAERLALSIDALAGVLRELEAQKMVTPEDEGLRIVDLDALERFADAA